MRWGPLPPGSRFGLHRLSNAAGNWEKGIIHASHFSSLLLVFGPAWFYICMATRTIRLNRRRKWKHPGLDCHLGEWNNCEWYYSAVLVFNVFDILSKRQLSETRRLLLTATIKACICSLFSDKIGAINLVLIHNFMVVLVFPGHPLHFIQASSRIS